ncbi:hypothetical protein FHX74_001637 [Friedmanniella endophytica]|uniref:Plasmid replication, integration and excision activator n=1 Tax=Microlunatus kandeliicorticis TaxID=1759536 RepID=A0A7W3IRR0_9ACTN|nr:hypothetical protein [Microlunatus kandeliicorticis]MBA8794032.1 hypothetical protein [Microlunatus kandeliicorticis]
MPVNFDQAFPLGLYGLKVEPLNDFEASTRENPVQARDKDTGELMWTVEVMDLDPEARERTFKVKLPAPHQPVLPAEMEHAPLRPVAFVGLTVTPWLNDNGGRTKVGLSVRALRMVDAAEYRKTASSGANASSKVA